MNFLNGKKTYTAAIGLVLVAVGSYMSGDQTLGAALTQVLAGLGIAGMRHGVSKNGTGD